MTTENKELVNTGTVYILALGYGDAVEKGQNAGTGNDIWQLSYVSSLYSVVCIATSLSIDYTGQIMYLID